jgi:hypothetical protein
MPFCSECGAAVEPSAYFCTDCKAQMTRSENHEKLEAARSTLVRYYSSQLSAHGTSFLAAIAAGITIMIYSGRILEALSNVVPAESTFSPLVAHILRGIFFGVYVAILTHVGGRLIFWGYMNEYLLKVSELPGNIEGPIIYQLHVEAGNMLAKEAKKFPSPLKWLANQFRSFRFNVLGTIVILVWFVNYLRNPVFFVIIIQSALQVLWSASPFY